MEQLDSTQRAAVSKMSTERLRVKLGKTDFDEQLVAEMTREQLLDAWAKCILAGRDKPQAAAATAAPTIGYDVELEKQRLAFETRKFEAELALRREEFELQERRRQEELEAVKLRDEMQDRRRHEEFEAARLKDELQRERELALYQLNEQKLRMKQQQWEWEKSRDTREAEKQKTPAAQAKFFGNVLKNVMPKFPSDIADIPVYFEGIEKLFISFEVPSALQAKLLLPHLNDKAKSLLLRLEQSKQDIYREVKQFLLNEFRLTPIQFKSKFERAVRSSDETYTMFCSRLKNLLNYYVSSRHVGETYDTLFSLLVADKIKTLLPETCLDHVLTVEGNSWLKCEELANTVDIYFANHTYDGRPKTGLSNFASQSVSKQFRKPQTETHSGASGGNAANVSIMGASQRQPDPKVFKPGQTVKSVLCFICQSPNHKQMNCPLKTKGQSAPGMARNYACALDPPVISPVSQQVSVRTVSVDNNGRDRDSRTTHGNVTDTSAKGGVDVRMRGDVPGRDNAITVRPTDANSTGHVTRSAASSYHSTCVAISDVSHKPISSMVVDQLSKLNYVDVVIHGIQGVHTALHDTGSEINLINRKFVERLPNLPTIGRIKIKGVIGPAVDTDITLLDISPTASDADSINIAPPLREVFAICDGLNENIILTADTVHRLVSLRDYESFVATTVVDTQIEASDSHVETIDRNDVIQLDEHCETQRVDIDHIMMTTDEDGHELQANRHVETDLTSADTMTLIREQHDDPALSKYFDMALHGNKQFFIRDKLLYHRSKVNGNKVEQLCLPQKRVETVLKIAHDLPSSGHQAVRRTNERIALSFFFPGQLQRVKDYCNSCEICQLRARERRSDLVPIKPIDRHEDNFGHLQADIIGPMGGGIYKYALVLTDVQSRYVTAYELSAPTAKNVVDKIIVHSSYFGLPRYISFDCGTHFTSELTKTCLARLGVAPRFHCPYNPRAAGLVERSNATLKQIISKLAGDMPSSWHKVLPFALWSMRTSVNETLGMSPYQAVFGRPAIGPLQLVCDDWTGKRPLPLDIAKTPAQYLCDLEHKLKLVSEYTAEHAAGEQARHTQHYNLRSRDKSFAVGERVVYLMPSSTHKLTRTWIGPCVVVKKNSPYSYIIDLDGKRQWCHANHLRKFNERVNEAASHNCAIIFDTDQDFGDVPTLDIRYDDNSRQDTTNSYTHLDSFMFGDVAMRSSNNESSTVDDVRLCSLENDDDLTHASSDVSSSIFQYSQPNNVDNVDTNVGMQIDASKLQHLNEIQRSELLHILNEFSDCFTETPGFCPYVEHRIVISPDFKPKRLREYRIPEILKPEIQRQIDELLKNGFIRPSKSPMASPIVAVLKGPKGQGGVRLTIDYRYINLYSQSDAFVMPHLQDTIQKVGASRYITVFDAKSGYWQLGLKEEDRWLSAFAYDGGLYEWCRLPFGLRTSGNTFCRCVQMILEPIRDFCFAFVDDMTVCSNEWEQHLSQLRMYLTEIRRSGLTLSLKKCSFAQSEVRFVGHVIGSGRHRPDEMKLATVSDLNRPVTKKDVRRMVGFFSYFRNYIPHLAELSVPFTNLLAKGKPNVIEWSDIEEVAFCELKHVLCECVKANLYIAQWGQPFGIHTDASNLAVGSCLVQWDTLGNERPIAFASAKLSGAQLAWAAVEKEAYAVVWSLNKFRTWIFGAPITIIADSNPLTYLTASAPKSAKLTRWSLALQEFHITFKYKKGREHVVPDYLSRPC
jgi:hypothetical protein